MSEKSIRGQIAELLGIKLTDLKAVIYYSDRSWTRAVVFGSQAVANYVLGQYPETEVSRHDWSHLKTMPDTDYPVEATRWGLKSGTVLLVSGRPSTG